MTTLGSLLLGAFIGWLGAHLTGRILGFVLWKIHGEERDPEFHRVVGGALMVVETIILAFVAGLVGYHAGIGAALVASLLGLLVIPVAVAGAAVVFDSIEEDFDLADRIYRSPVTVVLRSIDGARYLGKLVTGRFTNKPATTAPVEPNDKPAQ